MSRIIEPSHTEISTWQDLNFERIDDPSSGFAFPVKDGQADLDAMGEIAIQNMKMCYEHPELYRCLGIKKHKTTYRTPPVIECDCRYVFELGGEGYYGAYQCPRCGSWYNVMGQCLNPPSMWEEDLEPDY